MAGEPYPPLEFSLTNPLLGQSEIAVGLAWWQEEPSVYEITRGVRGQTVRTDAPVLGTVTGRHHPPCAVAGVHFHWQTRSADGGSTTRNGAFRAVIEHA